MSILKRRLNSLALACLLIFSHQTLACSVTYNSSSDDIKQTMKVGFDWHSGWVFNKYDEVCHRLAKNNASVQLSGMIWEHEKDEYIAYYSIHIGDINTQLVSTDFGKNGIIIRSKFTNPTKIYIDLFESINNELDNWYADGSFNSAVKKFHQKKQKLKGL